MIYSPVIHMAKRHAEEALEDTVAPDTPTSKRARVDNHADPRDQSNGPPSVPSSPNEYEVKHHGHNGEQEEKKLDEAAIALGDKQQPSAYSLTSRQSAPLEGYTDLYLDTIDRSVLDFDFEKLCSVTLSNINVYACLVCGKYYQGRGPKSHAYFHALEVGHHVYVNMQTKRFFVLPEGYEVKSRSLEDIKFVVDPRLSREEVIRLDREARDAWDLSGKKYRPGEQRAC